MTGISRWAALAAGILLAAAAAAAAQDRSTVRFEPGASSATLNGTVIGHGYVDYSLGASAGQTMTASIEVAGTNGHGSVYFNILPPGSDDVAIFVGSMAPDRTGTVDLPESGDYTIRVYLMGNDRDTGRTVGYRLEVGIE